MGPGQAEGSRQRHWAQGWELVGHPSGCWSPWLRQAPQGLQDDGGEGASGGEVQGSGATFRGLAASWAS